MIHPWELDEEQPVIPGRPLNVWRHRVGLRWTAPRLERLLRDFRFVTAGELAAQVSGCPAGSGDQGSQA
jgi:hypothetical protein